MYQAGIYMYRCIYMYVVHVLVVPCMLGVIMYMYMYIHVSVTNKSWSIYMYIKCIHPMRA